MRFEFYSAGRIIFGSGVFSEIGKLSSTFGKKALIILGKKSFRSINKFELLLNELKNYDVEYILYEGISTEPDTDTVDKAAETGFKNRVDIIIGIGGGRIPSQSHLS